MQVTMDNSFRVNVLNTLGYLQQLTNINDLFDGPDNRRHLTSLRISSIRTGTWSLLHSRKAPFAMNGDTRNSCGPSSYIPNKGSINRWERDRQATASV